MNDSAIFQGLARALTSGTPPNMWPVGMWKNFYFEAPVAVASHLQRFMAHQMQEQMQLASELAKDPNPANAFTKQAAFVQQSALAWQTEMLELAELVQAKLMAAAQPEGKTEPAPFTRAA